MLVQCACECIIFQLYLKMDSAVAVADDVIHVFDSKLGASHHFFQLSANDLMYICSSALLHFSLRAHYLFPREILRSFQLCAHTHRSVHILKHSKLCLYRSSSMRMQTYVIELCKQDKTHSKQNCSFSDFFEFFIHIHVAVCVCVCVLCIAQLHWLLWCGKLWCWLLHSAWQNVYFCLCTFR